MVSLSERVRDLGFSYQQEPKHPPSGLQLACHGEDMYCEIDNIISDFTATRE